MKQRMISERHARGEYGALALFSGGLLLTGASACGGRATSESVTDRLGGDFVSVSKALQGDASRSTDRARRGVSGSVASLPDAESSFYVAIRKELLGTRWFLSGFMKQFHPDNRPFAQALELPSDQLLVDSPLGTRVVSFEIQNDRLFLFDASDRFEQSALQDPALLIEAYPLVEDAAFAALPGADQYILFDPAQGLNEFSAVGSLYGDPYLDQGPRLNVGLSYLQNFRSLPDGAAFEQVFTGEFADDPEQVLPAWGTLGVALRRYRVGENYVPTVEAAKPFFFTTGVRFVPDTGGVLTRDPTRWNLHRGQKPVEVFVSAGAFRAQDAFPGVDILGAIERGIETWNDAFGFPVLHATFTEDDEIRDDGESFALVDYPGTNRVSHGNMAVNPLNGEIRASNLYIASGTFNQLVRLGLGAPGVTEVDRPAPSARFALRWGGMDTAQSMCDYQPSERPAPLATRPRQGEPAALDPMLAGPTVAGPTVAGPTVAGPTLEEQGAAWVQGFVVHEMGHALGLRHNFKGSLLPPGGTSVMDYQLLADSVALPFPGSYDVAAIRYLYQLSSELPSQPFCTDEETEFDPNCAQYDTGAAPLPDFRLPRYAAELDEVFASGLAASNETLPSLNGLLAYARDDADDGVVTPLERETALQAAFGRSAVPLAAEDAAQPERVEAANRVAEFVLRRTLLDPSEDRGAIALDITDPGVLGSLTEQAGQMLRNTDGVRSYALRRTAVDVLVRLQAEDALVQLSLARDELSAASSRAGATERPLATDLLARIEAALSPYFQ
jgi:hypothetical protein